MTKRRLLFGCLTVPACMTIAAIIWLNSPTAEPPFMIAVKTDSHGAPVDQIVCEPRYTQIPVLGPHGPAMLRNYKYRFFLEVQGQPRRELTFLPVRVSNPRICHSVDNSPLWIAVGKFDHEQNSDFEIFVFDATGVRTQRKFAAKKATYNFAEFDLDEGNRIVEFKSPQGPAKYDVVADELKIEDGK